MIQRIQTVYMAAVLVLSAIMCMTTIAEIDSCGSLYSLGLWGLKCLEEPCRNACEFGIRSILTLAVIPVAVGLLTLATIFMYNDRIKQIRFCVFSIGLSAGFYAMAAYCFWNAFGIEGNELKFRLPMSFPLISIILLWLSVRAIGKDEVMVRAADHLR